MDVNCQIPKYTDGSQGLSLVSFTCMLQDTGYPMEVYLPPDLACTKEENDYSHLKERWVGWAVE